MMTDLLALPFDILIGHFCVVWLCSYGMHDNVLGVRTLHRTKSEIPYALDDWFKTLVRRSPNT